MKTMAQSGTHPDAESLNAFAELALPAAERQQVLVHLASCDRCREVVFLAQAAAGAEAAASVPVASPEPGSGLRGLFAGWRWTWIPATALAGVVGFAVLHHFKSVPPVTEIARNTKQVAVATEGSVKPESAAPKPTLDEPSETKRATRTKSAAPTSFPSKDVGTLAKKESETANLPAADASEMASVAVVSSGVVGGSAIHGAAQKRSAIGGPYAANNQQQVADDRQEVARDQLHSARFDARANGATAGAAQAGLAGKADAQGQATTAAAPAPAREVTMRAAAKSGLSIATDEVAVDGKRKLPVLPNGAIALSTATTGGRTVAIDPSGAVFLNEAPGAKWTAIATQWTGRAVLVRVRGTSTAGGITLEPTEFELINDQNKVWSSSDGKIWLAETSPPQ